MGMLFLFNQLLFRQLTQQLLQKYQVPHLFEEDLFKFLEEKRPPFRWLLVGGKRSGSPIHIDPHSTSAWNSCLVGRKYWIMIPPDCEKKVAKGKIFAN